MPEHQFLAENSAMNQGGTKAAANPPVLYRSPANWPLDESAEGKRVRRYIRFSDRPTGFTIDFSCLERSLHQIVPNQQESGCFLSPEEILLADKSDDHLGVAGMLAYYLSLTNENVEWMGSLSRAVRFQIDHLCSTSPNGRSRYVRYHLEQDSPLDWCNTLWSLQGLNFVLEFGQPFLPKELYREALELGRDFWEYLTDYPTRDENPCHNQLLEYASIGYTYGRVSDRSEVCEYILDYYKRVLRELRILDRGRWIYTEFNRWCAHYALLSWSALEHLWAESREPLFEEDALEMAAAFNDRISAGGFYFGGSRRDEPGYETFLYQFWLRGQTFDFDRLLLPEPSNRWQDLIYDGHNGRSLAAEMTLFAKPPPVAESLLPPSVYTLRRDRCSVRFNENGTPRHISVNGLELIEANLPSSLNSPLLWKRDGDWVEDGILAKPPPSSPLHRYSRVLRQSASGVEVRATMQRGSDWEVRTWWITDGHRLQGIAHLIAHNAVRSDRVKFVLGNPCLTETEGVVKPVFSVSNSDRSVSTYGPQQTLKSVDFLQIGDQFIRASAPIQFVRPSKDAFDGFPARNRKLWNKQKDSNRIEILLSENAKHFQFRESLFAEVEIGGERASAEVIKGPGRWICAGVLGRFHAEEVDGSWTYSFEPVGAEKFELSNPAFGGIHSKCKNQ